MYCPTCGSDNQPKVRFCRRCGTSLEAVSIALERQGEDRPLEKSRLSQLIKNYHSGRHEMILGLASVALGIAIPGVLLATGKSGLFWIFVWIFMGVVGNGMHQFNKGWKEWSEASSEMKAMRYEVPSTTEGHNPSHLPEDNSSEIRESRSAETLQLSGNEAPASVTESTTRHLDTVERK